jgi:two-component system, cell cycle response regulator
MRILVAEDDKTSRLIIEAAVTSLGHECIVATSGEEAWRLFETVDVEVIISDRIMPGMDGLELCRRVRASNKDTYTYFIFLTILDERPDVVSGMEAGADDYLVKPLDAVELKLRMLVASRVTALHRRLFRQSEELAQLNRQLFDQSRTDSLTRLGNRIKLSEDLDTIGAQADRYDRSYCAIMCDVDYFKAYNDDEGHPAGDKVLQLVARALVSASRVGDQIYRYGGEEFLILLPEQDLTAGVAAANRFRQAVEEMAIRHAGNPRNGVVTISAGVAPFQGAEPKSIQAWLNEADAALYRAKQQGRNCVAHEPQSPPLAPSLVPSLEKAGSRSD